MALLISSGWGEGLTQTEIYMQFYSFSNPSSPVLVNEQLKSAMFTSQGNVYVAGYTEAVIGSLKNSGINSITLSWEETVDPSSGKINTQTSLQGINKIAAIAHTNGLTVALEPYFEISTNAGASFTSFWDYFGLYNILGTSKQLALDTFAAKFLSNFETYLQSLGSLAQSIKAAYMAVGGEMSPLDASAYDTSFWQPAIDAVRKVYSGDLTYVTWGSIIYNEVAKNYAANSGVDAWNSSPTHYIDMWKYLDLVAPEIHDPLSLVPYQNLTLATLPSYSSLLSGWTANTVASSNPQNVLQLWVNYAQSFGKPLITSESGFSSSLNPYSPPSVISTSGISSLLPELVLQAELTQTFFETLDTQPNLLDGYSYLAYYPSGVGQLATSPVFNSADWWVSYGWNTYGKPAYQTFLALSSNSNHFVGDNSGNTFVALFNRPTVIDCGSGNDVIYSQQNFSSSINGGLGLNTVNYFGTLSSHASINISANAATVSSGSSNYNADDLINISRLSFSDTMLALDNGPTQTAGAVYMLYQATFNRTPDAGGLGYWIDKVDKGANIVTSVAQTFVTSPEFIAKYGVNPTNASYVNNLYLNVLHRAGESGGVTYWNQQLNDGLVTKAVVLEQFATLAEGAALVAPTIAHGIAYTQWVG